MPSKKRMGSKKGKQSNFAKRDDDDKKESYKNQLCLKDKVEIKKANKVTLLN